MEKMGKKCVVDKGEVGYLEISESTTNIAHITQEVGALWGGDYRSITSNGAEVKDCSGTRTRAQILSYDVWYCSTEESLAWCVLQLEWVSTP